MLQAQSASEWLSECFQEIDVPEGTRFAVRGVPVCYRVNPFGLLDDDGQEVRPPRMLSEISFDGVPLNRVKALPRAI